MRPNILILYVDQHRWDALGANGNAEIKTPHLDRLARRGVSFSHCFAQNPLCMPSRASFLTGQYPSQLGITHMGVNVPAETPTLAHFFKQYGYTCANFGKLHFQTHANRDHRHPHPTYGFDILEISDEPGVYEDAYRAWVRHQDPGQLDSLSVGLPPARNSWLDIMEIEDEVFHPTSGPRDDFSGAVPFAGDANYTHTAFVAERTLDFLRNRSPGSPFLCISGFYSPHAPWIVPQRFIDLYDPDSLSLPVYSEAEDAERLELGWTDDYLRDAKRGYYAMISEVDHHVGRILDQLDRSGQSDNTIIIFTSDHGEWLGDRLRFGKGYPGDDPSTRVPLIVSLPKKDLAIDEGVILESIDVLPTLLDAAGIQIPPHLQGRSFFKHLVGRAYPPRSSAITEFHGWKSLRSETHRYLIHADGSERLWKINSAGREQEIEPESNSDVLSHHRHLLLHRLIHSEKPHERTWPY